MISILIKDVTFFSCQQIKMQMKRTKCLLCNTAHKSKFCISLHHHVHLQNSKASNGFECHSCKKKFIKFGRFEWHLHYHGYCSSTKFSSQPSEKDYGKFKVPMQPKFFVETFLIFLDLFYLSLNLFLLLGIPQTCTKHVIISHHFNPKD